MLRHLPVSGLLCCLFAAGPAMASPFSAAAVRHSVRSAQDHQVVRELQAARALLEKADHDYAGHRAGAVRDINAAIHELHHPGKHPHPPTTTHSTGSVKGKPGAGKMKEPQAVSDAQLREAEKILAAAASQLTSAHHSKPLGHVRHALGQLSIALKIK